MAVRVAQVVAITIYLVCAIAAVAYLGWSRLWLVPILAPALYYLFTLPDMGYKKPPLPTGPPYAPAVRWQAKVDARVAELQTGPEYRRKYIEQVRRGIPYPDERIEYLENPGMLVMCAHLRPAEGAMRAAGLKVDFPRAGVLWVEAIFQEKALRQQIALPPCVSFIGIEGSDNHAPPMKAIRCAECEQQIEEYNIGPAWPASG